MNLWFSCIARCDSRIYPETIMKLFRLDASPRQEGSHSRQIADIVQNELSSADDALTVINREIAIDPLGSNVWWDAVTASMTPEDDRSAQQQDAVAVAATLVDELVDADAMLFAVPLFNYGVSQHFKTWVDLVITDPRMGAGVTPATAGTPAVLVTVHGGYYAAGTPREGWDHATPWMQRALKDAWQLDLQTVEANFTLVGVNPALDEFKDLADQLRQETEEQARQHGRGLAGVSHS
jgi:FMN-dependent NADH-azoreductase